LDDTKVKIILASIQKQQDELNRLVSMVLTDNVQLASETIWRANHVSAPTFFENKTGWFCNCL